MKKYDLIIGIGCSFTEGGGLDSPNYHKYIKGDTEYYTKEYQEKQKDEDERLEYMKDEFIEYKKNNNYIVYLSNLLNCDYINLSESGSSNELIFEKIYKYFKEDYPKNKKILLISQLSIFTRKHVFFNETEEFLNLNSIDIMNPPFNGNEKYKNLQKYYELYITSIHNDEINLKNLVKDMEIYNNWLLNKNVDVMWLSYEDDKNYFVESKNFIKFDNKNLQKFAEMNKIRNMDLPNFPDNDTHFSIKGHEIISKKIYEHLEKKII